MSIFELIRWRRANAIWVVSRRKPNSSSLRMEVHYLWPSAMMAANRLKYIGWCDISIHHSATGRKLEM